MEALLRELWQLREIQELAQLMESGGGPALVTGLSPVHRAMTAAALRLKSGRPLLMLPRKRSVTLTLSPLLRNFLAAFTFVFKSFVSMFGERRTSLTSMVFCFFLASFSFLASS